MADLIFNPLLKKGFQYDNTAAIQAEIDAMQENLNALQTRLNALQNQKITKCFTAADLANLEDNEIFEWQGASGTVDETAFVNGYFYKKEVTQIVLVSPVSGAYITNADFSYNGFYYANGNVYAKNVSNTIPLNNSYTLIDINTSNNTKLITVNLDSADWQQPGTIYSYVDSDRICHKVTLVSCTGAGGAGKFYYDFGNGLVVYGSGYSIISGIVEGKSFVDTNDNRYDLCINPNITSWGVACIQVDSNNNIIDFWPSQAVFRTYYSDVTINSSNYSATDTQSRLLNIENASNGDINITQNLNVSGDLNVTGTQRIVHSEEIDSENDFINLRYNNPLALANDEQSGIKVENYDGNNNNCIFGVDNAGWARIGDESGTLQKIATIEENPTDAQFVQYDAFNKQLKTSNDGSNIIVVFEPATAVRQNITSGQSLKAIFANIINCSLQGIAGFQLSVNKAPGIGWYQIAQFSLQWGVSAIFDGFICGNYGDYNFGCVKFTVIVNAFAWNVMYIINSANHLTKLRLCTSDGQRQNLVTLEIYKDVDNAIVPACRFVGIPAINAKEFDAHDTNTNQWLSDVDITQV